MKKCGFCGANSDDDAKFCPSCGGSDFSEVGAEQGSTLNGAQTISQPVVPAQPEQPTAHAEQVAASSVAPAAPVRENIVAGAVGAFLFSLIGAALYVLIYQANIISGICGLVIFVLASFGYGVFARTKNRSSVPNIVVSVIVMAVMIFISEYICISLEIYKVYSDIGITVFDAISSVPEFLSVPEIRSDFLKELAWAYLFGFAVSASYIVRLVRERKNKK